LDIAPVHAQQCRRALSSPLHPTEYRMTRQGVALAAVSSLRAEVSGTVMES
jgi:hypothetical protein